MENVPTIQLSDKVLYYKNFKDPDTSVRLDSNRSKFPCRSELKYKNPDILAIQGVIPDFWNCLSLSLFFI
jgi:hypothetical protein